MGNADRGSVVKKIDDNRWKKITETVAACKKWPKQTKYDELLINFPENHHLRFGYHTSCYKNFTAVPKALCSNPSSTEELGCKQIRSERRSQREFSKVSCNVKNDTIEPYYKKLKISEHEFT